MKQVARLWLLAAALLAITLLGAAIASAQGRTAGTSAATTLASAPAAEESGENPAGEGGEGEKTYELPNFMEWIYELNREPINAWLVGVNANLPPLLQIDWKNITNLTFVFIIITIIGAGAFFGSRRRALRPKSRFYIFLEVATMWIYDTFYQVLGKDARKYISFIGTLFIYILCMNIFGLIPLMKSPTSVWGINAAMALCVFGYVQIVGITRNGILGYLKHFLGVLPSIKEMGCLGYAIVPFILILNIVLHILEELIKPLSLSLRLFGNIFGEDTLIAVFAGLLFLSSLSVSLPIWLVIFGIVFFVFIMYYRDRTAFFVIIILSALIFTTGRLLGLGGAAIPLQLPFMLLSSIFSIIQAGIFSLLTAVYIGLMLPHEEHAH
jgi:F-type H+-transporting ATPase subunit a